MATALDQRRSAAYRSSCATVSRGTLAVIWMVSLMTSFYFIMMSKW